MNAGLFSTISGSTLTICKMNSASNQVLCYGTINVNGHCSLHVGQKDVSQHHSLEGNPQSAEKVIAALIQMQLCPGNDGFQDLLQQRRRYSQEHVAFRGPDGEEVATSEDNNIIRHMKCHGLVVDGLWTSIFLGQPISIMV